MSGARAISTTSRRKLSSRFFFFLQGKVPKEIDAILTETLPCFPSGRAKDLSAPLYLLVEIINRRHRYLLASIYSIISQKATKCACLGGEKWKWKNVLKNERPTWCHLLFYVTSYVLNMFRTLIYPSSGACDCVVELPRRSSCSVKTDDLALV